MVKWIQKIHIKKGALRRELHIPRERKIPSSTLNKIAQGKIGKRVNIDGDIKVTRKLKKRAVLARTLRSF